MKKIFLFTVLAGSFFVTSAQSPRFESTMETNIQALDTTRSVEGLVTLANNFERIAEAEKNQWLPYYYAAYAQVVTGFMMGMPGNPAGADKTDPLADKAESLLNQAQTLTSENSELYIVRKMVATLRFTADPMNRYQTYGPLAAEALEKARSLDPENPRVYLLEGQDKFYTPEQFGGSKTEAKKLFEQTIQKFESFKPQSKLHPNWGLVQAKYFYDLCK